MKTVGTAIALALVVAAPVAAQVQFFNHEPTFEQFAVAQGKFLKDIETFEESTAPPGSKQAFPNSLQHGVPRPGFPQGIQATNLIIQTNITPHPIAPFPNPSGNANALWVNGAGFIGSNSIKVGNDEFLSNLFASLDLIFTTNDKTAVGLEISTFTGFDLGHTGFRIGIFDTANALIGVANLPAVPPEPNKNFFGVWSPVPIGRINIWGDFAVPQPFAVDDIQMWVIPSPGAGALLALGGLAALRRRR